MTVLDSDLDERIVAQAALDVATERLRSVCASHAPTFVAVERRDHALTTSLSELLHSVSNADPCVDDAKVSLDLGSGGAGGDSGEGKEEDGEGTKEVAPPSAASSLADLAERHRLRRRTLLQHSSLLELLELPSLMDACVRSNLYDEALSVAGFANTLERRHLLSSQQGGNAAAEGGGGVVGGEQSQQQQHRVVGNVILEIRRRESDLRRHLLHRLRGDVTMPQCLEVVTALRRLNGVELERRGNQTTSKSGGGQAQAAVDLERVHAAMELRLQVDFFEARDVWLDAATGAASASTSVGAAASGTMAKSDLARQGSGGGSGAGNQSEQILDGIERYRTRCFEIATQFLAIFRASNSSTLLPSSSTLPSTPNNASAENQSLTLLSMWTTRRIQTFLSSLSTQLQRLTDSASLRDALDAATFFATSMGRIGADFQPLLSPLFEPRMVHIVTKHWTEGVTALSETLKICRDAGVAGPLFSTSAVSATTGTSDGGGGGDTEEADTAENRRAAGAATTTKTPAPPRKLLALPPLARLVNAYLTGLNELRRCLLPGILPSLHSALDKMVNDVKVVLQTNERAVLTPGLRGEAAKLREVASEMKDEFEGCVEPYLRTSLDVAFGCLGGPKTGGEGSKEDEKDETDAKNDDEEKEDKDTEESKEEDGTTVGMEEKVETSVDDSKPAVAGQQDDDEEEGEGDDDGWDEEELQDIDVDEKDGEAAAETTDTVPDEQEEEDVVDEESLYL